MKLILVQVHSDLKEVKLYLQLNCHYDVLSSLKTKNLTISGRLIFSHSSSPLHFFELVANLFLLRLEGLHNLHLTHTMFLHRL